jgi:hypothetical protein
VKTRATRAVPIERSWRLSRGSDALEAVKRYVELRPDFCHTTCREAAAMATWELAGNVLKYGSEDPENTAGTITVGLFTNVVSIRTINLVGAGPNAGEAASAIARLANGASVTELYRRRLHELFENAGHAEARLGLLRVAFEGGFQLSCHQEGRYLEIAAHRCCQKSS